LSFEASIHAMCRGLNQIRF